MARKLKVCSDYNTNNALHRELASILHEVHPNAMPLGVLWAYNTDFSRMRVHRGLLGCQTTSTSVRGYAFRILVEKSGAYTIYFLDKERVGKTDFFTADKKWETIIKP